MNIPHFYFLEKYLDKTKHEIFRQLKFFDSVACFTGLTGAALALIEVNSTANLFRHFKHELYIKKAVRYEEIVDKKGETQEVLLFIVRSVLIR